MSLKKGRQIKHSDKVDLESIISVEPNIHHRQMISYLYKNRKTDKVATIVLMNPSSADKMMADNTIRRIEEITYHIFDNVKEVRVFNLFTVRGMNPSEVNDLYSKKGIKALLYDGTDKLLEKSVNESAVVIAAWGGPCGINKEIHSQRVNKVKSILKKCRNMYRIAGGRYKLDADYPLHGRLWGYSMKAYKFE